MTDPTRQAAMGALAGARTAAARLDHTRDPEDNAADLVEIWTGIETALRGLLHGSTLSGQDLVREVRKREMLTLTQAHTLLDFLSVRARLDDTTYKPTAADVALAREAVAQMEAGLSAPHPASAPTPAAAAPVPPPTRADTEPDVVRRNVFQRIPTWAYLAIAAGALVVAGVLVFMATSSGEGVEKGARLLRENRREAARAEFERVAREQPRTAEPHVFLSRMAREEGDLDAARRSAEAAVRAEPTDFRAHRELGIVLYTAGQDDAARRFFIRALERNQNDRTANGMLACTLVRLGRRDLAQRFVTRAGDGPWRSCITAP